MHLMATGIREAKGVSLALYCQRQSTRSYHMKQVLNFVVYKCNIYQDFRSIITEKA
jgi:hypothetical protein